MTPKPPGSGLWARVARPVAEKIIAELRAEGFSGGTIRIILRAAERILNAQHNAEIRAKGGDDDRK